MSEEHFINEMIILDDFKMLNQRITNKNLIPTFVCSNFTSKYADGKFLDNLVSLRLFAFVQRQFCNLKPPFPYPRSTMSISENANAYCSLFVTLY